MSILSTTQVSQNVILLALMFIYRLKKLNPGVKGKLGSEFRLFTVALMLGNKCMQVKHDMSIDRGADVAKFLTTTPIPTRPGLKSLAFPFRRYI